MSSFKRKGASKPTYPWTRISAGSTQTLLTSTGISSLDDILGGGLPLSCSLAIAAPDVHSSYGELVLKYFIAQGLVSGQRVCVIDGSKEELRKFVRDCMWISKDAQKDPDEADDGEGDGQTEKVKIAWRYENMKQFKTTVGEGELYCQSFDLSTTIPEEVIDEALKTDRLHLINVADKGVIEEMTKYLSSDTSAPVRICIPTLGAPNWGEVTAQRILFLLHSVRERLREHCHGCAMMSLSPQLSGKFWGGAGWLEKVGWMTDGLITMAAFTGNPGLSSLFPGHHGLVQIYSLPSPHTFSAPSDRFSLLRGLGSASGENNLAFKCTRRRLIIETLHLDIEGGTGERRTTASKELEGKKKKTTTKKSVGFQTDLYEF